MKMRAMAAAGAATLAVAWVVGMSVLLPSCSKQDKSDPGKAPKAITGNPSTVVATVDGTPIKLAEVDRELTAMKSGRYPQVNPNATEGEMQQRAVDDLITQKLLFAAATKAGMVPGDDAVHTAIDNMKHQFPDSNAFHAALGQQNMTMADLAQGYRTETAIQAYVKSAIQDTIKVTDAQAKEYFNEHPQDFQRPEQVHLRHIYFRIDPSATPAQIDSVQQAATAVYAGIHSPEDFRKAAQAKSEDRQSGQNGGDIGYLAKGNLPAPLDSIAFALSPGQISQPVRSPVGFHILTVDDRKPAGPMTFEDVQPRLMQMLYSKRTNDRVQAMVEEMKTKAKIKRKI